MDTRPYVRSSVERLAANGHIPHAVFARNASETPFVI